LSEFLTWNRSRFQLEASTFITVAQRERIMKSLLTRGPIGSCLLFSYCLLLICFQRVLAVAETVQINDAEPPGPTGQTLNREVR